MSKYMVHLGQRIREVRLAQRVTIEQLSERIGKSHNFVGNIERGDSAPAVQTLIDIANALYTSTDVLLQDYLTADKINTADTSINPLLGKILALSDAEQKDVRAMIDLMIHFKNIPAGCAPPAPLA